MPCVAIVADDYGMSTFRTDGILSCFTAGSLSQASLMVRGDDASRAARLARRAGLPLGLHLNLTEGPCAARWPMAVAAISGDHPAIAAASCSLVDEATRTLRGKAALFGGIGNIRSSSSPPPSGGDSDEGQQQQQQQQQQPADALTEFDAAFAVVLEELVAQLALFEQLTGSFPFALDGHHHCHVLPVVAHVLATFYRSPAFDGVSDAHRRLIQAYVPGTAAAAAVRAHRFLRVPPLGDPSRDEHWRSLPPPPLLPGLPPADKDSGCNSTTTKSTASPWAMWTAATVTGPPFFARIVACANEALNLWCQVGLFGPTRLVADTEESRASGQCSPHRPAVAVALVVGQRGTTPRPEFVAAGGRTDVVEHYSPSTQRRGVVVHPRPAAAAVATISSMTTTSARDDETTTTTTTAPFRPSPWAMSPTGRAAIGGGAPAIVPRRLVSFAAGPRVNADHIADALARFTMEERELAARREMVRAIIDDDRAAVQANAKRYKQLLARPLQLFVACPPPSRGRSAERDGEIDDDDAEIAPWPVAFDAEVMVHPSQPIPDLAAPESAPRDAVSGGGGATDANANANAYYNSSPRRQSAREEIESAWLGQTPEFYGAWARSSDRTRELAFLCSDAVLGAVAGAGYGLAAYRAQSSGRS